MEDNFNAQFAPKHQLYAQSIIESESTRHFREMTGGSTSQLTLDQPITPEGDAPHSINFNSGARPSTDHQPIMQSDERTAALDTNSAALEPRPFECPISGCDKSYRYKKGLKEHDRQMHQAKTHICPVPDCGRAFPTQAGAHNHQMRMHKDEVESDQTNHSDFRGLAADNPKIGWLVS